ncbi:MAG: hypothetical protein JWN86_3976 [Planctomycetota bacterium]|nr:hypothetical protein [Planctomycetota bacterium]
MRLVGSVCLALFLAAQVSAQLDGELSGYIAQRRKVMDDPALPIAERETVALEVAATLDRAAWAASAPPARRAAWSEARDVLDGFSSREKGHPRTSLFAFQASVYLWAEGQSWARLAERDPSDLAAHARAASAFEGTVARIRPLVQAMESSDEPLAQNLRFRFARALADLASLDPERPEATAMREEALAVLRARPFNEVSLKGHASLLSAELLARSGQFAQAKVALSSADRSNPAPPIRERLAALVPIGIGLKEFAAVENEVDRAPIDAAEKNLLRLRLALGERASLPAGEKRTKIEAEAFRRVVDLQSTHPTEFRLALLDLARSVDEPSASRGPDAWSLLAEGASLLGQPDRAARLDVIAASKAEGRGDRATARTLRFRAGAVLFQAGRFARSDAILSQVVDDPGAGPLRPRAGMLRALARGRLLAANAGGSTRESYLTALVDQIRRFPDDPATGEARWLLGRARLESGERAEAEAMWNSVPRSHARWIDARLALAGLRRTDLEIRRLVDDATALAASRDAARSALASVASQSRDDSERADVILEEIRLELVPGVGDVKRALDEVERLRRLPLRLDQRGLADRLRVVALAACERFLDAEQAAQTVMASTDELLALARDLDRAAASAGTGRATHRISGVERIVADRLAGARDLAPAIEAEIRLRRARGRMLAGDFVGARGIVSGWNEPDVLLGGDLDVLAELADLFTQIGDFPRAIPGYRRIAQRAPAGSPRWFAARLGHAQALEAAKEPAAAQKIVEGSALLYPYLGGPAMKERFEGLRRKLERPLP